MKLFCTEMWALPWWDNNSDMVVKFAGPNVPGIDEKTAQEYCDNNGLGYCKVVGELIAEIPCKEGTHEPDFSNMMDYQNIQNN